MKKKIFFIMSTNDYSGAETVNFSIIEKLKDEFDFFWVSKKGPINKFLEEAKINWIEINKLSVSEIRKICKKYKPDILHATDFNASVICSLANTKSYLIEHLHNNAPWIKKFCLRSIAFLYAGLKADQILTVSDAIENEYIFSRLIKNKIKCIGNPVSTKKILEKVEENDFIKQYDICCVGRLTAAKNPTAFLKIINNLKEKHPNIKAVWVGDGELKDEVMKSYHNMHLEENVAFLGFQKNPYKYMAQSKIFMLTSIWEGYGLVAFEALALGLPCIVSQVGGLPSIVDDNCGKICNSQNDFITEAESLLEDDEKYIRMSKNAKEKANYLDNEIEYKNTIKEIYLKGDIK